jgi:hypothetical protein
MVASPAPVAISAPAPILPVPELKPGAMHGAGMRVLEDVEREAILDALQRFSGHRQRTAAALGIGVRTLGLKLKKWKEQGVVNQYV